MSTFQVSRENWRTQGSLRYLADSLGVSVKQVTRYWDNGWIKGRYRTAKGQRRIRYNDNTVDQVKQIVSAVKEINIRIRYHIPEIDYCGTIVPVKGCTTMRDLHKRARQAGLSKRDAARLPWTLRITPVRSKEELKWELLYASQGITEEEAAMSHREFAALPLATLMKATDAKDFRAKARKAWKGILKHFKAQEGRRARSSSGSDRQGRRREVLRKLLSQPDLVTFLVEWNKETEVQHRILETEKAEYLKAEQRAEQNPKMMRLGTAAFRIKHLQLSPSAANLAQILKMSRPALYRTFGAEAIRDALRPLKNDALAIREGSIQGNDKRKRQTKSSQAQVDSGPL